MFYLKQNFILKIKKKFIKEHGLTLIETLIITAIIALITLISIPSISSWIASYRLSKDTQNIASEMMIARARAVSERTNISLTIATGSGYAATYQFTPGGQLKHCTRSITINSVAGDNPIIFNSRGMASNATTINLANERGSTKSIDVNVAGRIVVN